MSTTPGSPHQTQPTPKKSGGSSVVKIVLIVVAVLVLGCVCCSGASYMGFGWMMNKVGEEILKDIKGDPILVEKLGDFGPADMSMELVGTSEEQKTAGSNVVVMKVKGSKATGKIIANPAEKTFVLEVNGERFKLGGDAETKAPDATSEDASTDSQ